MDSTLLFYCTFFSFSFPDRTVKIYNVSENSYELTATLQGHQGPVWQVSWAHPQFGVVLASCSFDGSVQIHKEVRPREWMLIHQATQLHESSVNGVAFAPQQLQLAAASADGRVSVLTHQPHDNTWSVAYLQDCPLGVNAVSWSTELPTDNNNNNNPPRLVTAGCDGAIRVWKYTATEWTLETTLTNAHSDWVRDVAWAPSLIPDHAMIASCSEDRTVQVWNQTPNEESWKPTLLHTFDEPVWKVSWSVTGHLLAVSSGDSNVSLWKAGLDGTWSQVATAEEPQAQQAQAQQQPAAVQG